MEGVGEEVFELFFSTFSPQASIENMVKSFQVTLFYETINDDQIFCLNCCYSNPLVLLNGKNERTP